MLGTGVHSAITCREEDEKVSEKGANGQFNSVVTGKKIPSGFKGIDYNMHTVVRFYRDEDNNVIANVIKERTGVHTNEILEDPTLLDWQVVIDGNKGRKDFVLKNSLDTAVDTEQEIYSAEIMSNATKSMSKSDMEKARAKSVGADDESDNNITELQAAIKSVVNGLNPVGKKEMKEKLTKANLPTAFTKVTDVEMLKQILAIVSE